ncbi:MAG TPA: DUF72 domain-containing protein [Oligoflexus sp.]|uniref:DUF72 domain-containing protein n=1 Tax=Oligoflexus sp. TaxID=1971216 RepID=UPI002D343405|nr:DUF72 domain-containing protein [Oligoflexus sp.]HYX38997.1 DUF72 domain-containing protein [Oligoflexus sp.]
MGAIFIGMAGWAYDGWRGSFYPEGLKQKDELAHASRRVHSIEINGTFYSLFRPNSYLSWYEQTPPDFNFSIKGPKYITHERRLKDFQTPLSNFLASGILALREKLGCILWQFPPNMPFTVERFEPFLAALPHDMQTAANLGTGHSPWMEGRTYLEVQGNHRIRHAVEGRHPSFRDPAFVELARKYGVAIVVGDTAGRWPLIEDVTTDFLYLRLHADEVKYPDGYTKESLESWGHRIQTWSQGMQPEDAAVVVPGVPPVMPRSIFAYFDNAVKETAPLNALSMITWLTQGGVVMERQPIEAELGAREKFIAQVKTAKKTKKKADPKPKTVKKAKVAKKAKAVKKAKPAKKAKAKTRKKSA